jgi:hypothetical protein
VLVTVGACRGQVFLTSSRVDAKLEMDGRGRATARVARHQASGNNEVWGVFMRHAERLREVVDRSGPGAHVVRGRVRVERAGADVLAHGTEARDRIEAAVKRLSEQASSRRGAAT